MKTRKRIGISALLLVLAMLIGLGGWLWYDSHVDRSGWKTKNGVVNYLDFHGKPLIGWQQIQQETYYFAPDEGMVTGWRNIDGVRTHFGEDGVLSVGWQIVDGQKRCFSQKGTLLTGWQDLPEGRFYLMPDGCPVTYWQEIGGSRYYFDENGALCTLWQEIDGSRYYLGEDGILCTGWVTLGDDIFYLGDDGAAFQGETILEGNRYFFREDGSVYRGWMNREDGAVYYDAQGAMAFGLTDIDGRVFYFDENGLMLTGWQMIDEYRYFFGEDGAAAVGPREIDGRTWYFTPMGIQVELVNRNHPIRDSYDPDLVTMFAWYQMSRPAADAMMRMLSGCTAAGIDYNFNSSYRSMKQQTQILEDRTAEYMEQRGISFEEARAEALKTVAYPGTSEHQMGLAADILGTAALEWLSEHCWEYGFIVRYPENKSDITGIDYEPWHFRYVGTVVSMDMKDSGLCLEEYLGAA